MNRRRDGLPAFPVPCTGGCGRIARRMIRVRELHVDHDPQTGAETGRHIDEWMVPYCHTCTPADAERDE